MLCCTSVQPTTACAHSKQLEIRQQKMAHREEAQHTIYLVIYICCCFLHSYIHLMSLYLPTAPYKKQKVNVNKFYIIGSKSMFNDGFQPILIAKLSFEIFIISSRNSLFFHYFSLFSRKWCHYFHFLLKCALDSLLYGSPKWLTLFSNYTTLFYQVFLHGCAMFSMYRIVECNILQYNGLFQYPVDLIS